MTKERLQLLDNVFLTYVPAEKFKTDFLSVLTVRKNTVQRPFRAAALLRRTSIFACGENLGAGATR